MRELGVNLGTDRWAGLLGPTELGEWVVKKPGRSGQRQRSGTGP